MPRIWLFEFREQPVDVSGLDEIGHEYLQEMLVLVHWAFAGVYLLAFPIHLCSKRTTVGHKKINECILDPLNMWSITYNNVQHYTFKSIHSNN